MVIFALAMPKSRILGILFSLACFVMAQEVVAQRGGNTSWTKYRHEAQIGYGVNTLFSSLGEKDKLGFNPIFQRSTFSGSYRYYFLKRVSARASLTHAFARKNHKDINPEEWDNIRLDYTSTVTELALLGEYHIFDEAVKGKKGLVRRARGGTTRGVNLGWSVYTGVAFGLFRPFAEYFGQEVELKPIPTDTNSLSNDGKYRRLNFHIPLGTQVRFILSENWRFGAEFGYRIGIREYINNTSWVYYRDPEMKHSGTNSGVDQSLVGPVTFEKELPPIEELGSKTGRKNYMFIMLTLAYRFKS